MAGRKKSSDALPVLTNNKARHKFFLGDKYTAGICLCGTEVKSIRSGNAQISESFAKFVKDELFLFNANIAEYDYGNENNHPTTRPRKLLLKKRELERIQKEIEAVGKSLVPTRIFFQGALIKCELAIGSGKNQRDKRQDLKKRTADREVQQAIKNSLKK